MKEYEYLVIERIKERHDEILVAKRIQEETNIILNSDINHATILIKQMFLNAKNNMRLLSNSLDEQLFSRQSVIKAVQDFLNKEGTNLEILIETDVELEHPLLTTLTEYKDQVTIKKVDKNLVKKYSYNFVTMDGDGYRFEDDRSYHEAIAEYGNQEDTKRLNSAFNSIFQQSEDYQLA